MAEISRKSGRRIIESIDTKKSSKQEVYDFYKRFRAQKKRKGEAVPPMMKIKDVKKADIVKQLEVWERQPYERKVEENYKKLQQGMLAVAPSEAAKSYRKFQKDLQLLQKSKLIDIKNILGGTLATPFEEKPPAAPKAAAAAAPAPQPVNVTRYKGRFAHDLIAKWVDDGLIDNTDDYEDSEPIWQFMAETTQKAKEYEFFQSNYEGENLTGTNAYYDDFKEFLQDCENFERAMRNANKKIPDYGTREYWQALSDWREEQENRPF